MLFSADTEKSTIPTKDVHFARAGLLPYRYQAAYIFLSRSMYSSLWRSTRRCYCSIVDIQWNRWECIDQVLVKKKPSFYRLTKTSYSHLCLYNLSMSYSRPQFLCYVFSKEMRALIAAKDRCNTFVEGWVESQGKLVNCDVCLSHLFKPRSLETLKALQYPFMWSHRSIAQQFSSAILTVNNNKLQVQLFDSSSLSEIYTQQIDTGTQPLVPHYDYDSSVLFLSGKVCYLDHSILLWSQRFFSGQPHY